MAYSFTAVDLDYEPLFSVLDEQDETDNALKRLTDWDFDDEEDSFAEEEDLFPIREYKTLGSNLFESSTPLKTSASCSRAGSAERENNASEQFRPSDHRDSFSNGVTPVFLRTESSPSPIYGSLERDRHGLSKDESVIYDIPVLKKPQSTPQTSEVFYHNIKKVKVHSVLNGQNLTHTSRENFINGRIGSGYSSLSSTVTPKSGQACSSFGSPATFPLPARKSSIQSTYSSSLGTPTGSLQKKRVKIMCDVDESLDPREYPDYRINPESVARVSFPSTTWDTMMRNLCIALEANSVFMCDKFLGTTLAEGLWNELEFMKGCGLFERHIQRPANSYQSNYACVFLQEEDGLHKRVDGLVLMMVKLANYFTKKWNKASVQLCHYPAGQPAQHTESRAPGYRGNLLKCIYFPNRQIGLHPDEGIVKIRSDSKYFTIAPVFDRLVAFWGDSLEHEVSSSHTESYLVTLWLQRF